MKSNLIPPGMTEEEVATVIQNVTQRLVYRFKFGYHTLEDIKQQAALFAWECLERYDNKRPLENFLWTHVRNRLFSYKRDNYERPNPPCVRCPKKCYNKETKVCGIYGQSRDKCSFFVKWGQRNISRRNIMHPINMTCVDDENESRMSTEEDVHDSVVAKELLDIIDEQLPTSLRSLYIKMRNGISVPKQQRQKVQTAVLEIIQEYDGELQNWTVE